MFRFFKYSKVVTITENLPDFSRQTLLKQKPQNSPMEKSLIFLILISLSPLFILHYNANQIPNEFSSNPQVYFCPKDNCTAQLLDLINSANHSIYCAFYDLNIPQILQQLTIKSQTLDIKMILESSKLKPRQSFIHFDYDSQQMHNKFCIFDQQTIFTGSYNPTFNGNNKNNNNIIIINSKYLSKNYYSEFQELIKNKKQTPTKYQTIYHNNQKIENYFCPEDNCAEKIINIINSANQSIYFMTFSFTDKQIAQTIINKHLQGIKVAGLFEKSQNSKYSQFNYLNTSGINVKFEKKPTKLHHKIFIIDQKIIIAGSYNPTKNGNTINDENILIIHNPLIAQQYLQEFNALSN